jgi:AcrR family transcriptional regulator
MSPRLDDEIVAVLDAAAGCYLRLGVAKTRTSDIARAAGMSRATLYRRFGTHESIFLGVLERESESMAAQAQEHLAGIDDEAERLIESMMFSIDQIRSRPAHAAIFTGESTARTAGTVMRMSALRRIGVSAVRPLLSHALDSGALSDEEVADLVDWILRVLLSYAAIPGPADLAPPDVRRQLTSWFLPAFQRFLGD